MSQFRVLVSVAVLAGVLAGCVGGGLGPVNVEQLGEAAPALMAAAETHNTQARRNVAAIEADALITRYDGATEVVSVQRLRIEPARGRIRSTALYPGGSWQATVGLDGDADFQTTGRVQLTEAQQAEIASYLRLILHRVRGPLNLLGGGERPVGVTEVFQAGLRADRVESTGRRELARGYFFELPDHELRMITAGGLEAGQQGTVSRLWNSEFDGLLLPVAIRVTSLGGDSLLGDRRLMDVEFNRVTIQP